MNKRLYVDFHILQTVPPSCINRDDTGSPQNSRVWRCDPCPGILTGMEACHARSLCGECSTGRGQAH